MSETITKRIKELTEERTGLQEKLSEVNSRLARTKIFAAEYDQLLIERNNISAKIAVINVKITNRKNKLPENGYSEGISTIPKQQPTKPY